MHTCVCMYICTLGEIVVVRGQRKSCCVFSDQITLLSPSSFFFLYHTEDATDVCRRIVSSESLMLDMSNAASINSHKNSA